MERPDDGRDEEEEEERWMIDVEEESGRICRI